MADERIDIKITGDGSDASRAIKGVDKDLDRLGKTSTETSRRLGDMDRGVVKTNQNLQLLDNTVKLLKFPTLIAGAGLATQSINALGAGAVALTSSLAPLSGALAAYPALLGAMGQAAGVTALAGVDDLMGAVGGLNEKLDESSEAFKQLTPEAQAFAREMQKAKKPLLELQEVAQGKLFAGADKGLKEALQNFDSLGSVVEDTAESMSRLMVRAGKFAGRDGFGADFEKVGASNAKLLENLGKSGLHFADALRHVMVEARPLIKFMGEGILSFSKFAEEQMRAARSSGDLARFFAETQRVMSQVVDIGGSMINVLMDIGHAADPLGDKILKSLVDGADALERWTGSVEGQNKLREYFQDAKGPLFEMGRLTKDLVEAFFEIGRGPGLKGMIRQLRVELLPALTEMVTATTKAFGPVAIEMLVELSRTFGTFAGSSGPLVAFVRLLTQGLRIFNDILDAVPALKEVAVTVAGIAGIAGVMKKLPGVGSIGGKAGGPIAQMFGQRGTTPANPLFVTVTNQLPGGGGTPPVPGGGGSKVPPIVAGIRGLAGPLAAATVSMAAFDEITTSVQEKMDAPLLPDWMNESGLADGIRFFSGMGVSAEDYADKVQGATKVTAINGRELFENARAQVVLKRATRESGNAITQLGRGLTSVRQSVKLSKDGVGSFADALRKSARATKDYERAASRSMDDVGDGVKKVGKTFKDFAKDSDRDFKSVDRSGDKMADNVGKSVQSLTNAVTKGYGTLEDETNDALKTLGVKAIAFGVIAKAKAGTAVAASGKARGGIVRVPGSGNDDTVPLFAQGGVEAMVAPGEDLMVVNRHQRPLLDAAVAGQYGVRGMGDFFNKFDRPHNFAAGGIVALGQQLQREGYEVGEHPAFGGVAPVHTDGSYHYSAQAIDVNDDSPPFGAGGSEFASLDALHKRLQNLPGVIELLWQVANHYDHLHVAMGGGGGTLPPGSSAMAAPKIPTVSLTGPEGAWKNIGQGGLDMVHQAAQEYVNAMAPTGMDAAGPMEFRGPGEIFTASWYGPTPATVGAAGVSLPGTISFAELSSQAGVGGPEGYGDYAALGGLPMHTRIGVQYGGETITPEKLDVGAGGPGLNGHIRAVDLWEDAAKLLPGFMSAGIADVKVMSPDQIGKKMAGGGFLGIGKQMPVQDLYNSAMLSLNALTRVEKGSSIRANKRDIEKDLGRMALDPVFAKKIANEMGKVEDAQDMVDRIETVASDSNPNPDIGGTKEEWLTKQKNAMLKQRNLMIAAIKAGTPRQKQIEKLVEKTKERVKDLIKEAETALKKKKRTEEALAEYEEEKKDKIADVKKGLEKAIKEAEKNDDKKLAKALQKKLDNLDEKGFDITSRRYHDRIKSLTDKDSTNREKAAALNRYVIPKMDTIGDNLKAYINDELKPDLDTLHGSNTPMKLQKMEQPLGYYGGEIIQVQQALRELGNTELSSDEETARLESIISSTQEALARSQQSNALLSANIKTFTGFNAELPYVGAFAAGTTYVPETGMALVHEGERIITASDSGGGPGLTLVLNGDIAPLIQAAMPGMIQTVDESIGRRSRRIAFAPGNP
jgi:hypothetical protein